MSTRTFEGEFRPDEKSNVKIINERKVINGLDDGLMQVYPLKHPWAWDMYQLMKKNTWFPQEVSMGKDVEMWEEGLTEQEKTVYKRSLAFVSNLDGLQTHNLVTNIVRHFTSPEIVAAVVTQAAQEVVHVESYQLMVETMGFDAEEIYGMYRRDKKLYDKNKAVLESVNNICDPLFKTGTFENDQKFLEACFSNIILEGLYFYSAFLVFYTLKRNNKMPGSGEMIQFINRDEDTHLELFIQIVNELRKERPELFTEDFKERVKANFHRSVDREYEWGVSCIEEGILGLNPTNLREYLEFIADDRLKSVGYNKIYNTKNPFPWIDDLTQENQIEQNFFEGTVRSYQQGSLSWD